MTTEREFTRAEQALIDQHRDWNVHDEWYDYTKTDFAEQLSEICGITVKDSQFTGFCSQGDGASFITYSDSLAEMLAKANDWLDAHQPALDAGTETADDHVKKACVAFARWLVDTYSKFRLLGEAIEWPCLAVTRMSSHYVHEHTMSCEWEISNSVQADYEELFRESGFNDALDDKELTEQLRALAHAYYLALEAEYEFQTSDEQVWESLEANGITPEADEEEDDDAQQRAA